MQHDYSADFLNFNGPSQTSYGCNSNAVLRSYIPLLSRYRTWLTATPSLTGTATSWCPPTTTFRTTMPAAPGAPSADLPPNAWF